MIHVDTITFRSDRMVCDVHLDPGTPTHTTPAFARDICAAFPALPLHTCVNSHGSTLGDCLERTSLPHVLEHLVIDFQVSYDDGIFVGTTEWLDRNTGTARIEVSYRDDVEALRALQQAVSALNGVLGREMDHETEEG